jgi:hypothetical protein
MSKRVRRPRPTPAQPRSTISAPAPPKTSTSRRISAEEFAEEYAYVGQDLRRIFMVAAVMFLLMILLNVLIRFVF